MHFMFLSVETLLGHGQCLWFGDGSHCAALGNAPSVTTTCFTWKADLRPLHSSHGVLQIDSGCAPGSLLLGAEKM